MLGTCGTILHPVHMVTHVVVMHATPQHLSNATASDRLNVKGLVTSNYDAVGDTFQALVLFCGM